MKGRETSYRNGIKVTHIEIQIISALYLYTILVLEIYKMTYPEINKAHWINLTKKFHKSQQIAWEAPFTKK